MADAFAEAVALEVREVVDDAFSESVLEAMVRSDDLAERYGEDAAREFWGGLQDAWLEKAAR